MVTKAAKKAIVPKEKRVMNMSSTRPARPTPSPAIAAGASMRNAKAVRAEKAVAAASRTLITT